VAVLDADKEGFLRSERSLIQTAGRAARNIAGEVILYADTMTGSMRRALDEMNRRREKQLAHNAEHGITPRTIVKSIDQVLLSTAVADAVPASEVDPELLPSHLANLSPREAVSALEKEMLAAAKRLEFERAASLRDRIEELLANAPADGGDGGDHVADAADTAQAALHR